MFFCMLGGLWRARDPMIFGFNTDIAAEGTVYHVQTEVREQESRLESQVFVRGRCIGKRAVVAASRTPPRRKFRSWRGLSTAGLWKRCAAVLWTMCSVEAGDGRRADGGVAGLAASLGRERAASLPGSLGRLRCRAGRGGAPAGRSSRPQACCRVCLRTMREWPRCVLRWRAARQSWK